MGMAVEYQKVMTEVVYINLPGPDEASAGMSGSELLHGFLAELHEAPTTEMQNFIMGLCNKWNIHYRNKSN